MSFDVEKGEFVALLGPSGAGKTTTLNVIGGMDNPDSGTVEISGRKLSKSDSIRLRREKIGFVFSEFYLIPTLTAIENVMMPLLWSKKVDCQRADDLLSMVELGHRKNHYPRELSGGEMQRVAIARALINEPEIILADEPTANLDTKTRDNIMDLFRKLNSDKVITIILATHDRELARRTKRIIRLEDGRII